MVNNSLYSRLSLGSWFLRVFESCSGIQHRVGIKILNITIHTSTYDQHRPHSREWCSTLTDDKASQRCKQEKGIIF